MAVTVTATFLVEFQKHPPPTFDNVCCHEYNHVFGTHNNFFSFFFHIQDSVFHCILNILSFPYSLPILSFIFETFSYIFIYNQFSADLNGNSSDCISFKRKFCGACPACFSICKRKLLWELLL